ncbi:MAG: hypothetical protein STHCBS139747_000414 [Sporothrix thermara]
MPETTSPTFSDPAADYAIPRAILAPHIMPAPVQAASRSQLPQNNHQRPRMLPSSPPPQLQQQQQRQQQRQQQQQQLLLHRPPPPEMHNPSVLHPVFFTENLQRRRSFGQPAVPAAPLPSLPPPPAPFAAQQHNGQHAPFSPYRVHPAFFAPLAPPAPPLPHASSPVAHGYIYREMPRWPRAQQVLPIGIGARSKL